MSPRARNRSIVLAVVALLAWAAPSASAETIYGVTAADRLVTLDSAAPETVSEPIAITGLADGEVIRGIDVRPATLQLYALGSTGQLYRVDTTTGEATAIGSPVTLFGTDIDIDFDPTSDRLRTVTDFGQNQLLDPDGPQGAGSPATGGDHAYADGSDPDVVGIAYTANAPASAAYPGTPSTALYGIDTARNALVRQDPPDSGQLTEVGQLGVDPNGDAGFDVSTASSSAGADTAYAVMSDVDGSGPRLYGIDLTTGAATAIGAVGGDDPVVDIAVRPAVPLLAILQSGPQGSGQQSISQVAADRPGVVTATAPITGLAPGESLIGLDRRPDGGALYAVSDQSRIYTIDPATGAAVAVSDSPFTPAVSGTGFGLDFDPAADRLRLVSGGGGNLRLNPADGTVAGIDGALAYSAGDVSAGRPPSVTAAAYSSAGGTLFVLDTEADALVTQDPDSGSLQTIGSLGVPATDSNGFDIAARFNQGFAALQAGSGEGSALYAVNAVAGASGPADGSAVAIGALGLPPGTFAQGLTIARDEVKSVAKPPKPESRPGRVKPQLTGRVSPARDRKGPFRFTVRGRVRLPSGVSKRTGCRGKATIYTKRGGRTVAARRMFVKPNCHYKQRQSFSARRLRSHRGTLKFFIRFQGNHELKPKRVTLQARFGR